MVARRAAGYERWGARLDELAERVFGGPLGQARARAALVDYDRAVGRIVDSYGQHELLRAQRIDWALCNTPEEGATWAWRAAAGELADVTPAPEDRALAGSVAGLFEVWPGTRVWLRCRVTGLSLELDGSVDARAMAAGRGPGALWETRVVVGERGAELCRRPLEYPLELVPMIERSGRGALDLLALRRAWIEWTSGRAGGVRECFGPAL
jgi:hypothetical protein